jgi:hypothetical protein
MSKLVPKEVKLQVRTADQTRRAELDVAREKTAADLMQSAVDHWSLPSDTEYTLVNLSSGKAIPANVTLSEDWVKEGDQLEVQPVLVAG